MYLKYRPEIDGLRTIAVLSVIFYHADFLLWGGRFLPGGFIGVDVFFVISGYLIGLILLRKMQSGEFSFINFYERRIRRILPALFVVMAVTTFFSWQVMLPKSLTEYSISLISSLGFGSNIWFFLEDSYVAEASALKPLLHTWSLSVEEQFYVFFPVFLLLIWKYARDYFQVIFLVLFSASLVLANYASQHFPDASFYLLPTRAWELLAGAILAKMELDRGRSNRPELVAVMPKIGLLLIAYSVVAFNDVMHHPSFITLLPVLGTMLIIWFAGKGELTSRLLGSRAFVFIGLISYSLYLWHTPVFALARTHQLILNNNDKLLNIGISIVLAVGTYFIVEKPFRSRAKINNRTLAASLGLAFLSLAIINTYVIYTKGVPDRFPEADIFVDLNNGFWLKKDGSPCWNRDVGEYCDFSGKRLKTVLLVGDSHANRLSKDLYLYAQEHQYRYIEMTRAACIGIVGLNYKYKKERDVTACASHAQNINETINKLEPSLIVFSARTYNYFRSNMLYTEEAGYSREDILVDTLSAWSDLGHTVAVVYPAPEMKNHVPRQVKRALNGMSVDEMSRALSTLDIHSSYEDYLGKTQTIRNALNQLEDSERILKVRPAEIFCSKETDKCAAHDDEKLFYSDRHHMSSHGARLLVNQITDAFPEDS